VGSTVRGVTADEISNVAETLFRAFERNDTDAILGCCEPDARFFQNGKGGATVTELLPGFATMSERIGHHRYSEVRRETFDGGFVEEHRVTSTLPDGSPMDASVCVVGRIGPSGKLVELREYADLGRRAPT
jgi:ketosteroid isomerase-like protein